MSAEAKPKLAVVLFNLGGPDSLDAVQPFLFNLFNDPAILGLPWPARPLLATLLSRGRREEASRNYAHMGGASPLLPETQKQAAALLQDLATALPGYDSQVFLAMRYWRPFTQDAARKVAAFQPDQVVLLPLYPQYSTTTTGSSVAAWRKAYRGPGEIREVCCFPDSPGLAAAHAEKIKHTLAGVGPAPFRLLFSAHGLPEQVVKRGDPYQSQIERTCEAVVRELGGVSDWRICYQSRVGPLKWIGPSTPEAITAAGAEKLGVVVVPIAFVSEHVETLVELDRDYAALAQQVGCPSYMRVAALGVSTPFITALTGLVASALSKPGCSPGAGACDRRFGKCPYHLAKVA